MKITHEGTSAQGDMPKKAWSLAGMLLLFWTAALFITGCAQPTPGFPPVGSGPVWVSAPALQVPRRLMTLTVLSDGRVLAAGNYESIQAGSEVYDPRCNCWSAPAAMPENAWNGGSAFRLADGRVVLVTTIYAIFYDPKTDTWSEEFFIDRLNGDVSRMLDPSSMRMQEKSGIVLMTGGYGAGRDTVALDFEQGTIARRASLNQGREDHVVVELRDGRVLVAGGSAYSAGHVLKSVEIYDPAKDAWTLAADMRMARSRAHAALLPDGRVMVVGGYGSADDYYRPRELDDAHPGMAACRLVFALNTAEIYDLQADHWQWAAPMGCAGAYEIVYDMAALPDGRLLLMRSDGATQLYDPKTDAWTDGPAMLTPRGYGGAVAVLPDGKVMVAGGVDAQGNALDAVEIFIP